MSGNTRKQGAKPIQPEDNTYMRLGVAAKRIGIPLTSLCTWATAGQTKSGFHLDINRDAEGHRLISEESVRLLEANKPFVRASKGRKFRMPQNLQALDIVRPSELPQEQVKIRPIRYPRSWF